MNTVLLFLIGCFISPVISLTQPKYREGQSVDETKLGFKIIFIRTIPNDAGI